MKAYLLRRLGQTLLVLFVTSGLVFGGLYLVGDPVEMLVNPAADQEEKARAAAALGLDKPVLEQYWHFLKGAATADLGKSFVYGRPAIEVIRSPDVRPALSAGPSERTPETSAPPEPMPPASCSSAEVAADRTAGSVSIRPLSAP